MKKLIFLLFLVSSAHAQMTSIKGKIIDEKTKEILPFVNVFIGNTTKGTATNEAGEFTFSNLPIGAYKVVASMVGYQSISAEIVVKEGISVVKMLVLMKPDDQKLEEITVKSKKDKDWEDNLKKFQRIFFGTTDNAKKCKIINPYSIDFEEKDGKLFAKSAQPILIENNALGYKITFILKEFEASKTDYLIAGDTFFEEMAAFPQEKTTWKEKRLEAYQGSLNHFLQALSRQTTIQDGFEVYAYSPNAESKNITNSFSRNINVEKYIFKVNPDSLIKSSGILTQLDLTRKLEIHYTQKNNFQSPYTDISYEVSQIESKRKLVRYNQFGLFENQFDVFTVGSFSNNRIANLLPIDFQPPLEELIAKKTVATQENNYANLQEKIVFHTNKSNYYLGETIWFKTYFLYTNPSFRDALSRVAYVDLINSDEKIVESKVLKIKEGVAFGDFTLNDSLRNGIFYLRAYTNWMRNFGDSTQTIFEFSVLGKNQKIETKIADYQENSLIVSLNKSTFKENENIEISLNALPYQSYSMAVTNEKGVKLYQPIKNYDFEKKPIILEKINFSTETGRTFFGKVRDAREKPIEADLMVIRKDTFLLDNYQSDKKGEFRIENIVGKDTLVIDILANDKKGKPISDIVLNEPSKPKFYRPFSKNIFQITDNQSITKEKLNYDYDFDIDKSIILDEVSVKAKPRDTTQVMRMHKFFGKPTFGFSYKQLNFNGKFHYIQAIQGRVPGLNINFDAATGKIYLSWTRQGVPPPAVWVDGMAMKDINDAGFLTNDMIARIDVYRSSVIVPSTNTGLISIFTKTFIAGSELELVDTPPADGMRRFKMKGFYTPKKFYLPDNQNDSNKMTLLENRSTIYWNPEITTNHKGEAKLSFRAIAKEGKYRIELVGFNENGEIMKIEKGFWIGQ